jgi:hypothetical protein
MVFYNGNVFKKDRKFIYYIEARYTVVAKKQQVSRILSAWLYSLLN